jgi:hypothetical protein
MGILFKMRRFEDVIELAEFAVIDQPQDIMVRALLAFSHNAMGSFESAIYVLENTGLPESQFGGWRTTEEEHAFMALKNALYALGETELAHNLARITIQEIGYTDGDDWFINVYKACDFAILSEDDEAKAPLSQAQMSLHLAWDPVLKDSPCFEQFKDDPVYLATVRHFDDRRAMLRKRLPATLAEFGVEL